MTPGRHRHRRQDPPQNHRFLHHLDSRQRSEFSKLPFQEISRGNYDEYTYLRRRAYHQQYHHASLP